MPNPEYPQQPPSSEQIRSTEQGTKNDTGDLALLAEFYLDHFRETATTTAGVLKSGAEKEVDEMTRIHSLIAGLTKNRFDSKEDAQKMLDELERGFEEEMDRDLSEEEEEENDKGLSAIRRARIFLDQNYNSEIYDRKDFSDWLKARNLRLRKKRGAEDARQELAAKEKGAGEIEAMQRGIRNTETQVAALTLEEIDKIFEPPQIRTVEDIKNVVTPEVKAGILVHILKEVDARTEQGKRIAAKDPGAAVEARGLGSILGPGAVSRRYQLIASASEGKIMNATEVGKMKVYEFLKKYLDYDLNSDDKRKQDLEQYTNMLD
jgi:hypothetical protein